MSMPAEWASVLGFALALALLVTGHLVRVARWSLMLRQVGPPQPTTGFIALSLAYVINTFVPLRLGELARVVYYASRTRTDVAYVLAATVVERAFDLVAVWAIVLVFAWYGTFQAVTTWTLTLGTAGVAVAMVLAANLVERSATFRRGIWLFASLFNSRIRLVLLDATWSVGEVLRESDTNRVRLGIQTLVMWVLYIASYKLLSDALGLRLERVFDLMHGAPLEPTVLSLLQDDLPTTLVLLGYASAPFAIILSYSLISQRFGVSVRGAFTWLSNPLLYVNRIARSRSHFSQSEQYSGFLTRRFSGANDLVSDFEANALDDAIVQRMFRGGSDALTSMVQVNDELRIRKYALGSASRKLEAQCDWLERHASDLPLVSITHRTRTGERFLYDMRFSETSRDLFDTIHTYDVEISWRILADVLDAVAGLHEQTRTGTADPACIARYATEKVSNNLEAIRDAFPLFFDRPVVSVNGVEIDLALLDRFAAPGFVPARLRLRDTAIIHGDLTIENVLADAARPRNWFLIDPNVGNVFESPLLDYAKILQSLHLGYESLNRDISCSFGDGLLTFPIARTAQYAILHERATGWMRERFGDEGLREIRLHEIVHYFRLTPYKFRKSSSAGLVFLGCLCLLVRQYFDEFE